MSSFHKNGDLSLYLCNYINSSRNSIPVRCAHFQKSPSLELSYFAIHLGIKHATVHCGRQTHPLISNRDAICGLQKPQFIVAGRHSYTDHPHFQKNSSLELSYFSIPLGIKHATVHCGRQTHPLINNRDAICRFQKPQFIVAGRHSLTDRPYFQKSSSLELSFFSIHLGIKHATVHCGWQTHPLISNRDAICGLQKPQFIVAGRKIICLIQKYKNEGWQIILKFTTF